MIGTERHISLDFILPTFPSEIPEGGTRGRRGRYFAALRDHGMKRLSPELRHAYNAAILGKKKPLPGTSTWTREQWDFWLDAFARHCRTCPGWENCRDLHTAKEMSRNP